MSEELTVEVALTEATKARKEALSAIVDSLDPMADPSLVEDFVTTWEVTEQVTLNAVTNDLSLQMEKAIADLEKRLSKAPAKRTRKAPAKKVVAKEEAKEAVAEAPTLTLKDLREAATAYMKSGDLSERKAEVIGWLKEMGVTNLMKLPEDKWAAFYEKVAA